MSVSLPTMGLGPVSGNCQVGATHRVIWKDLVEDCARVLSPGERKKSAVSSASRNPAECFLGLTRTARSLIGQLRSGKSVYGPQFPVRWEAERSAAWGNGCD